MESPPSKNGKKTGPRKPPLPKLAGPDPQTAAWCTASNPNPGAELQPGLGRISLSFMRLCVVNCDGVLRTAGIAVLGLIAPPLVTVCGPRVAGAVPGRGAVVTALGGPATAWEAGATILVSPSAAW